MEIFDTILVVMAKKPEIGKTKTRLCPPFTHQQAADFYQALLIDTLTMVGSIADVQMGLAITPENSPPYFSGIIPAGTLLFPVDGENIGQCLHKTMAHFLAEGYQKVIVINSDGPSLPKDYLSQSINLLKDHDLVIGPSEDGGYYLIGCKEELSELFCGIAWSTDQVFDQTVVNANSLSLLTAVLPKWYDVDRPEDAIRLANELKIIPPDQLLNTRRFFESFLN